MSSVQPVLASRGRLCRAAVAVAGCVLVALGLFAASTARVAPAASYGAALQKATLSYDAQRSADLPPTGNRISWRDGAGHIDRHGIGLHLTGAWYAVGDHMTFGPPMAFSTTMLAWGVVDYRAAYPGSGQLAPIPADRRRVNDYFVAAHPAPNVLCGQVDNGGTDRAWRGPAEMTPMAQTGPAVAAGNTGHAATIPAGGTVTFGSRASYSGTDEVPVPFARNGITCTPG
jgi:hypothetical protein